MRITFPALLKEISVKALVSGDKSSRIMFEVDNPSDELINELNKLMKADAFVQVTVASVKNA